MARLGGGVARGGAGQQTTRGAKSENRRWPAARRAWPTVIIQCSRGPRPASPQPVAPKHAAVGLPGPQTPAETTFVFSQVLRLRNYFGGPGRAGRAAAGRGGGRAAAKLESKRLQWSPLQCQPLPRYRPEGRVARTAAASEMKSN